MEKLDKLFAGIEKILEALIFVLFLVVIASGFCQVIARQVFRQSFVWSEELCRYAGIWMILLATATAFKRNEHISLDYFLLKLPLKIQKIVMAVNYLFMMFAMGWFSYYGFKLMEKTGSTTSSAMKLPMGIVYVVLVLGGVLSCLFILHSAMHYYLDASQSSGEGRGDLCQ